MENKFVSSESILSRTSLCSYFVGWKIYLLLGNLYKIALMSSTKIIIPFRMKFGPFKNRSRSFSFSHFLKMRTEQIWLYLENYFLMYFIQKLEDRLTLKSSLNEQKYFFLTFKMKKCHVIFVVGNFFQESTCNRVSFLIKL